MLRRMILVGTGLVIAFLLAAPPALAQITTGTVSGNVKDAGGGVIPGATVVLISETRHGFVCANAGVDRSNAGAPDTVVLLPVDPDASAARIRGEIADRMGATVAVVITDTFGRAWREGHTNVAIGIAGLPALKRYIGQRDPEGYELRVTEIAVADEIAGAAELVMGKLDRCPVAVVRGLALEDSDETAREYVRPAARDLFR